LHSQTTVTNLYSAFGTAGIYCRNIKSETLNSETSQRSSSGFYFTGFHIGAMNIHCTSSQIHIYVLSSIATLLSS